MKNKSLSDPQPVSSQATHAKAPPVTAPTPNRQCSLAAASQPRLLECQSGTVDIAFYLPNSPIFPDNWQVEQANAIEDLIQLNGNHWRKIFTIMAKISCTQSPQNKAWQHVRTCLFNTAQPNSLRKRLHMGASIIDTQAKWHIICGQQTQANLGLSHSNRTDFVDEQHKVSRQQYQLFTPYLDYRQFPNALIEQVHRLIHASPCRLPAH